MEVKLDSNDHNTSQYDRQASLNLIYTVLEQERIKSILNKILEDD